MFFTKVSSPPFAKTSTWMVQSLPDGGVRLGSIEWVDGQYVFNVARHMGFLTAERLHILYRFIRDETIKHEMIKQRNINEERRLEQAETKEPTILPFARCLRCNHQVENLVSNKRLIRCPNCGIEWIRHPFEDEFQTQAYTTLR